MKKSLFSQYFAAWISIVQNVIPFVLGAILEQERVSNSMAGRILYLFWGLPLLMTDTGV